MINNGVWDGVVYDNRGTADYKEPEGLDLKNLLQFNNGNPVMTFISHRGFLVFHPHANLLFAMTKYYPAVNVLLAEAAQSSFLRRWKKH